jgi:hypothetical protein
MNSIAEAPRNAINTNGLQDSLATPLACWEPLSEFELIAIPTIRHTSPGSQSLLFQTIGEQARAIYPCGCRQPVQKTARIPRFKGACEPRECLRSSDDGRHNRVLLFQVLWMRGQIGLCSGMAKGD